MYINCELIQTYY